VDDRRNHRLQVARVAARLRRERQIDIEIVRSHHGEFKVRVNGETVIDGGALAALDVLPSGRKVLEAVRSRLST
jgi:hypothetical protein